MVTLIVCDAQEICQAIHISEHCLIEIVEHGIVKPKGNHFTEWQFDNYAFSLVRKAVRIQKDLELDWAATALALTLLNKIDQLTTDNHFLRQRLHRLESSYIENL